MVEAGLESRKDDQLREEYLSRIQADIEADKQALERRVGFFVGVKEFSQEMVDWLDADTPVDQ